MQGLITAMVESDVLGAVDPVVAVLVGRGVNRCMGEVRPVPVVGMLLHPRAFKRGAAVVGIPTTWECVYGARVARAGVEAALAEDLVGLGHAAGAVLVVRIVASQLRPGGSTYVVRPAVRPLRWLGAFTVGVPHAKLHGCSVRAGGQSNACRRSGKGARWTGWWDEKKRN